MTLKLGTTDAAIRLGSATPAAVYLGSEQVWTAATVPGAPFGLEYEVGANDVNWGVPESDGGSPILHYRVYFNGVWDGEENTAFGVTSPPAGEYEVSAVNAIGEGPKAGPVTVT